MQQTEAGIRQLKNHLSAYLRQVKAGAISPGGVLEILGNSNIFSR